MSHKKHHGESINVTGFYLGIAGIATSLIGISLSVYSLVSAEKAIWLGISGWISTIICSSFLMKLCMRLININAELSSRMEEALRESIQLSGKNERLRSTNEKLIDIDSYIISKALNKASPRQTPNANIAKPSSAETRSTQSGEDDDY